MVIERNQMIKLLNNHLTGVAESISCSGEYSYKAEDMFNIFKDFYNGKGINISWRNLMECYHLHDTCVEPKWLAKAESVIPDFLVRFTKRVTGL